MKHYGIENEGELVLEKVATLPAWIPTDEGRIIYDRLTTKVYFGGNPAGNLVYLDILVILDSPVSLVDQGIPVSLDIVQIQVSLVYRVILEDQVIPVIQEYLVSLDIQVDRVIPDMHQ